MPRTLLKVWDGGGSYSKISCFRWSKEMCLCCVLPSIVLIKHYHQSLSSYSAWLICCILKRVFIIIWMALIKFLEARAPLGLAHVKIIIMEWKSFGIAWSCYSSIKSCGTVINCHISQEIVWYYLILVNIVWYWPIL